MLRVTTKLGLNALMVAAVVATGWLFAAPCLPDSAGTGVPFPSAIDPNTPICDDPWSDDEWLAVHFENACRAVESICGARFEKRPSVASVSVDEFVRVLRRERTERGEGAGSRGRSRDDADFAEECIGYYSETFHQVVVLRAGVEAGASDGLRLLVSPGTLLLVLVHEVTHALDRERFPEGFARAFAGEDRQANLTFEGHAHYVCGRAAEEWGLEEEFAQLDAWVRAGMYAAGRRFIDSVEFDAGRQGVDATLECPPQSGRDTNEPDRWVAELAERTLKALEEDE